MLDHDSKQKQKELHTSERTIVPWTVIFIYFLDNLTSNLTSNFGPCPMSLAAAFRNTTKIVADKVINQSWGAIDDGMWWCYFGDGATPSKIFVFYYARDCLLLFSTL